MLDKTDRALIEALKVDPRVGNRQLAQALGISEVTVAARLRALFDQGMVRTTVKTDIAKLGKEVLAYVDVYVGGRSVDEVIADLCAFDEIIAVTPTLGPSEIVVQVIAPNNQALAKDILPRIGNTPGVRRLEFEVFLDILKYSVQYGRIMHDAR